MRSDALGSEPEPQANSDRSQRKAARECRPKTQTQPPRECDGKKKGQSERDEYERFACELRNVAHVAAGIPGRNESQDAYERQCEQKCSGPRITFRKGRNRDDQKARDDSPDD